MYIHIHIYSNIYTHTYKMPHQMFDRVLDSPTVKNALSKEVSINHQN